MNPQKNTGLIHKEPEKKDYALGSPNSFDKTLENQSKDWSDSLPELELQSKYGVETMGCVSFSYNNCQEVNFKHKFGKDVNFSDRFLAKVSGTTKNGNWYKDVAQAARDKGLVSEEEWPWPEEVDTWADYYKNIPEDVKEEALGFKDFYELEYEWVDPGRGGVDKDKLERSLLFSPSQVSVYAWDESRKDGDVYMPVPGVDSAKDTNHAVMLYKYDGENWYIFDHYDEEIKKLHEDYFISSAMIHSVTKKVMFRLVKGSDSAHVYAEDESGKLHHIYNEKQFDIGHDLGLWGDWDEIEELEQNKVDDMEEGRPIAFLEI